MKPTHRSIASTILLALALSPSIAAHDFWIEPSTFDPAVNALVKLQLRVGEEFLGEPVARNDDRIRRFVAVGPDGQHDVPGRDGTTPAGITRFAIPGLWRVAYESRPSSLRLDAARFEQYLREEGLERVIDERRSRNETARPGHERFSRSVKALIRAGDGPTSEGYDRPVGLALELVPERNPFSPPEDGVAMRLLFAGGPLEGALVVATRKDADHADRTQVVTRLRTDRNGRVVLPIGRGVWLIKAVHMVRATEPGADWESVWTSLTFRVGV